jgi:uncharacterized membrane protein YkvA (DUF1232 family)
MSESLSSPLSHYFSLMLGAGHQASPTTHVAHGADCVSPADLANIRTLLPQVALKLARPGTSGRLRRRIELLARFMAESPEPANSPAHREVTFVLFYFLRGLDLIPDSIPEIGLMDDALLVDAALHRNLHDLRNHWVDHGRVWPETL